jgi:nitrous oxidase accessory protein NosD
MQKNVVKKGLVITVILLFIYMYIAPSFAVDNVKKSSILVSDGNTLYVGGNGEGNYTKIQDAIDNATDGDTVFVYDDSSSYYENVVVDKSISLIGENRNTTVVDGGGIDSVIEVSADYVNIEGFTVTNCRDDLSEAGINIFSDWNIIKNNSIVENQLYGIAVYFF